MIPWSPPPQFDEYTVERMLGRGAMGQVYLGRDRLLERPVALKFIAASNQSDEARERFLVEARAIARLHHPNVVMIYRVGLVDGKQYLAYEFVSGKRLDQLPRPLPPDEVMRLARGLARGLGAAHSRGILHRDVKAENAIVSDAGDVKLLDFGLAKLTSDDKLLPAKLGDTAIDPPKPPAEFTAQLAGAAPLDLSASMLATQYFLAHQTRAGMDGTLELEGATPREARSPAITQDGTILGTPLYMAPEIWIGQQATPRSDIYSLGVLIYYLATGKYPHEPATLTALMASVLSGKIAPLSQVAPEMHSALSAVVERCLARNPADRYDDADDLLADLDARVQLTSSASLSLRTSEARNPYQGLRPFGAAERAKFFGRERDTDEVRALVAERPFVLVAGDSGVGKSSLCRAGVLPEIDSALVTDRSWTTVELYPGVRPVAALCSALSAGSDVAQLIAATESGVDDAAREVRRVLGDDAGVVVFVDQLEELLTLASAQEAERFSLLVERLCAVVGGFRFVGAVRSDFLGRVAALPGFDELVRRGLYLVRSLAPIGVREAIVAPARAGGVRFESADIVDELVAVADGPGGLPLLQFALGELWNRRKEPDVIVRADLDALGGAAGALTLHADQVIAGMPPARIVLARALLVAMVRPDGKRDRIHDASLDAAQREALADLVRGRLVVSRDSEAGTSYELAHELLRERWALLRNWLDESAGQRVALERVRNAAAEWSRLGRAPDALWSDRQLGELGELDVTAAGDAAHEFVVASRRRVRRRTWSRIAAIVCVPLLGLAVWRARDELERRAVAERVATLVEEGDRLRDSAAHAEAERLRGEALAAYDAADDKRGKQKWESYEQRAAVLDRLWGQAHLAYESALLLDSSRRDVRARIANVLADRATLARRDQHEDAAKELFARLEVYDDGTHRARLHAPAQVRVTAVPANLPVELHGPAGKLAGAPPWHVPPGNYRVVVASTTHASAVLPIVLAPGERHDVVLAPPRLADVPKDWLWIPAGRGLFGTADLGDEGDFMQTAPLHAVHTDGFLIQRHETTFAEWIEYLDALAPAERAQRTPSVNNVPLLTGGPGRWRLRFPLPAGELVGEPGQLAQYASRPGAAPFDWTKLPVVGIAPGDAIAYAQWLDSTKRVRGARLCDEFEWERAARGADGRRFPHGPVLAAGDANVDVTWQNDPARYGPDPVGSYPRSASPFGVLDMAGNVFEMAKSRINTSPLAKGGAFKFPPSAARLDYREATDDKLRNEAVGLRLCATR